MYSDFNKVINFLVFSIFLSFSAVSRADTEKIPLIIDYISYELIENQVGVVEIQQLPGEGEFSVNWQFTSNYSTYVLEEYPLYSSSSTFIVAPQKRIILLKKATVTIDIG